MTIKEAKQSIEVYKRAEQLTGIDNSEAIRACEDDIEKIRQERKTRKMVREMKAKKDYTAWSELLGRTQD